MDKNVKSKSIFSIFVVLISIIFMGLLIPFSISLFVKDAKSDGFYGEVALRSYFECGTGRPRGTNGVDDPGDPYVITRPRHMYNLSRLQGLGVFGENTYFQLGLVGLAGDTSGKPLCYLNDSSGTVVPFLDMSSSTYIYEPINAIGSEAVPFYGEFDGQGLEIKNLNVYADPEDAGLFGYTAHGSNIHDLFLDNITIHALGYTPTFSDLYGPSPAAANGASFTYQYDNESPVIVGDEDVFYLEFDASVIFDWDGEGDEPTISTPAPVISFNSTNPNYRYKLLISGDFLEPQSNNEAAVSLSNIYNFFKRKKGDAASFPLNASSSVSLIASTTDNYGLEHSKVIATLEFDMSLISKTSPAITMTAHLGDEHGNNIGLVIGHCDGTVSNCYVYRGAFKMNDAQTSIGNNTYNAMENGSNYGLIGLVGGTVYNLAARESDAGTQTGKDIGVLDFSTVYDEVITASSFTGSQTLTHGVTYTPSGSMKYAEFLRKNGSGKYVTLARDTLSFNRSKVIANADLGIFTIATDQSGTGMNEDAENGLENSVIRRDDPSVDSKYYIYYATGEYAKTGGVTFDKYRDSFTSYNPSEFHLGYHFPNYDEITSSSFEYRNRHQNYFIRFEVDATYRNGKGFYFSDVDKNTVGGSFLSKYFEHILVDKEGHPITAAMNSSRSGVMLRDSLGREIRKLNSSFATPDKSFAPNTSENLKPKFYCVKNDDYDDPAANMVNFEVKTSVANVTVVAGLVDNSKPAALGVYKIDGVARNTLGDLKYINGLEFENPDYAFFMPTNNHLAYFDYKVDSSNVGHIGVYDETGENWEEATIHTEATVPGTYIYKNGSYQIADEYGYSTGKTRLYAHTFKLPRGRYCLGSATGVNRKSTDDVSLGIAKIYYLCAQGQTDGQIEFVDNTFASEDTVENIDFIKKARYSYNEGTGVVTTNITTEGKITTYDPSNPHIENQRCYVSFVNSDRSYFDDDVCNLSFVFDPSIGEHGAFVVTSNTTGAVIHIALNTYAENHNLDDIYNTAVQLFGASPTTTDPVIYPSV